MTFDWTKFEQKIFLEKPLPEVFLAWTTAKGLKKWFLKEVKIEAADGHLRAESEDLKTGDRYSWEWYYPAKEKGHVLEVQENKLFKFTFGMSEGVPINVTVRFESVNGCTKVTLQQSEIGLSEDSRIQDYLGCSTGWCFFLTNLKSILEHGIDLREKKSQYLEERPVNH